MATHTPQRIRQAQDLAAYLGHLNKGIPSLIGLYAAAPDLLAVVKQALEAACAGDAETQQDALQALIPAARAAIAKAEAGVR
ncbi:MAG: hypothetical protein FD189_1128 [Elusimicrobia bacterium]|nr:MAG: hypothetical protein FD189_1128 [Elusimicrobiota bacterium]